MASGASKWAEIILLVAGLARTVYERFVSWRMQQDYDLLHQDPGGWLDAHFPGELHRDGDNEQDAESSDH